MRAWEEINLTNSAPDRLGFMYRVSQVIRASLVIPAIALDNLFSSRRSQIVNFTSSTDFSSTKPTLFYVHYSKNDILLYHEIESIKKIRNLGIQICLIINSDSPKSFLISELFSNYLNVAEICVVRKNIGYDLGAYRDVYKLYKVKNPETSNVSFFMNNSVIWLPGKIQKYFKELLNANCDIVAGSTSNQYLPHIQTFLFGSRSKIGLENLESWLSKIKNWRLKRSIVTFGELKTNSFFHNEIRVQSFPALSQLTSLGLQKIQESGDSSPIDWRTTHRLSQNRKLNFHGFPVNPSHDYWLEMLEFGFPGIKVDLVARNPSEISDYNLVIEELITNGHTYEEIAGMLLANKPKSLVFRLRNIFKI
jgi:hypothetical protein